MMDQKISTLVEQNQFFHLFQPIYELHTQRYYGFEGLFRSSLFDNPELAFQTARNFNQLYELEMKSIQKAICTYNEAGLHSARLFLNVFPSTIMHPDFARSMCRILANTLLENDQIILELNESELVHETNELYKSVQELRKHGFLIAIDDMGKGSASLRSVIILQPEIIKMEHYFSLDLCQSKHKQEMIKSVLSYCENTNTRFILEGLEKQPDLERAKQLGVKLGQGYLLGIPDDLSTYTYNHRHNA